MRDEKDALGPFGVLRVTHGLQLTSCFRAEGAIVRFRIRDEDHITTKQDPAQLDGLITDRSAQIMVAWRVEQGNTKSGEQGVRVTTPVR